MDRTVTMPDEIKLQKDAARGERAAQLLQNELLKEALDTLESDYSKALFETRIHDSIGREKLFIAVNVVRKVRDHLAIAVANGKIAQSELNELADLAERRKLFGLI